MVPASPPRTAQSARRVLPVTGHRLCVVPRLEVVDVERSVINRVVGGFYGWY